MMKFTVALALVVAVVNADLSEEQSKILKLHHDECVKESGVDENVVTQANEGKIADDSKLRQHILCMMTKTALMDGAGKVDIPVNKAKLFSVLQDKIAYKYADECAVQKDTPELTAIEMFRCYISRTRKILL